VSDAACFLGASMADVDQLSRQAYTSL